MSEFDYSGMAATATELIARYGAPMRLVEMVKTGPAYDPTLTPDYTDCIGVKTKFKKNQIDGQRVLQTDLRVLLAADQLVPTLNHRLEIGGKALEIIDVDPLEPGDTALMYVLHVRR